MCLAWFLAGTVSCNLPQSLTRIGLINFSWKSFLKGWSGDCLSLPRGSACSLTEQDWSATAQPGGLNLVGHTRRLIFIFNSFFCIQSLLSFPSIFDFLSLSTWAFAVHLPAILHASASDGFHEKLSNTTVMPWNLWLNSSNRHSTSPVDAASHEMEMKHHAMIYWATSCRRWSLST